MQIGSSPAFHNPFLAAVSPSGNAAAQAHDVNSSGRTAASDKAISNSGEVAGDPGKAAGQTAGQGLAEKHVAEQQAALLRQLKARDREVRQHEAAHQAVGGSFAGAVSYTFRRGPDGVAYAVGGEVPIDISPSADPEATIEKMQVVRAAAMAPAQPSTQDLQVAATAAQIQLQAQVQLAAERRQAREEAHPTEAGSAEQDGAEVPEGEVPLEAGQAGKAASAYQSVGDFTDDRHSQRAVFEARA